MTIDVERLAWIIGSGAVIILLVWATQRVLAFAWRHLAGRAQGLARILRSLKFLGGGSLTGLGAALPGINLDWLAELIERFAGDRATPAEAARPVNVPIKGRVAFDAPDRMRQGQTVTAMVRITRDLTLELYRLAKGMEPETTGIREVEVAPKMRVALKSENEGDFTITSFSTPEQGVTASEISTWQFRVRAERRGLRKLILCTTMLGADAERDLEPWEHEIEVALTPGYGALRLVRTHPGAALSVLALPFVGLLFEVSGAKDATQDLVEPRVRALVGLPPRNEVVPSKELQQGAAPVRREE